MMIIYQHPGFRLPVVVVDREAENLLRPWVHFGS